MIRPLAPHDVDAVVAACDWLFAPPSTTPALWDPGLARERLKALCSADTSTGFVAEVDREVAGFCTVYLDLMSVRLGQRAWLNELAVDPAQRSRGLGKRLFDAATAWARDRGATHLILDSHTARVDAHRFYVREQPTWQAACFGWQLTPADGR